MARTRYAQTNFTGGELSPRMWHRFDMDVYANGAKVLENVYGFPQGGVTRRSGTHFVAAAGDETQPVRLVPFVFSQSQAYVLEFGHNYVRFFRAEGQLVSGDIPVTVSTPYTFDELPDLDFAASGDVLYIVHPDHAPAKLIRESDTVWRWEEVIFRPKPSHESGTRLFSPLTLSATTGAGVTATTTVSVFITGDIDRHIVIGRGRAVIREITSVTEAVVDVIDDFDTTGPHTDWLVDGSPVVDLAISKTAPKGAAVTMRALRDNPSAPNLVENGTFADFSNWDVHSPVVIATGVADNGAPSATVLVDATDFIALGVRPGMFARNVTDSLLASVVSVDRTDTLTTTTLPAGDWDNNDTYEIVETSSQEAVGNTAYLVGGPAGTAWIEQDIPTVAGFTYELRFDVIDNAVSAMVGSTTKKSDLAGEKSYEVGNGKSVKFTATGGLTFVQFRNNQNWRGGVRNVACRQLSANAFYGTDLGSFIKAKGGIIEITDVPLSHRVTGIIRAPLSALDDDDDITVDVVATAGSWTLEVPSWSDVLGWPAHVAFHQDRLVLGPTEEFPTTVWGSVSGDYENFAAGLADDQSFEYPLATPTTEAVKWLVGSTALLVGTGANEIKVTAGPNAPLTPTAFIATSPTTYGSANVRPVLIGPAVLFVQRTGRRLRALAFSIEADDLSAFDMQIFADHVAPDGFAELTYQAEPNSMVWARTTTGKLVSLTLVPDQKVRAWHRHPLTGAVESLCTIPVILSDGSVQDQVWLAVARTVKGQLRRYIEFLDDHNGWYNQLLVDSGLIYDGPPTSTITGLSHLEGLTVAIQGNGAAYPSQKVVNGQVTGLSPQVTHAEVGLPYTMKVSLLRPVIDSAPLGGLPGADSDVFITLSDTLGLTVNGDDLDFRDPSMPMDAPPALFSGEKRFEHVDWEPDVGLVLEQRSPLPCTILVVTRTVNGHI